MGVGEIVGVGALGADEADPGGEPVAVPADPPDVQAVSASAEASASAAITVLMLKSLGGEFR